MRTNRLSPTSGFPCPCCQNHSTMVTCSGKVSEVLPLSFRTQSSDRELTVTLSHNMITIDEVTFKGSRSLYPASTLFNEPKTKITASNGQGGWENDTKQSLQSATLKYKVRQRQTVNWFLNLTSSPRSLLSIEHFFLECIPEFYKVGWPFSHQALPPLNHCSCHRSHLEASLTVVLSFTKLWLMANDFF